MSLRLAVLRFLVPISKGIGRLHAPFTHKRVNGPDVFSIQEKLVPGYVLLSFIRGELSNLFIPGEFTHAAMVIDDRFVIEAVGGGVRMNDIISFMTSKDRVVLLRPLFADDEQRKKAVGLAQTTIGAPYDYLFEGGNRAFYCSELIQWCYERSGASAFTKRKRFNISTVTPNDFAQAEEKWELVWDSDLT